VEGAAGWAHRGRGSPDDGPTSTFTRDGHAIPW